MNNENDLQKSLFFKQILNTQPVIDFIDKYSDPIKIKTNQLIWNSLQDSYNKKILRIEFENLSSLNLKRKKDLFFYVERECLLYKADYVNICKYIDNLEPWEELDGYIFDETLNWFIALTHESIALYYNG